MNENELAKRMSPRLCEVLASIAHAKSDEYAVVVERGVKLVAILAQLNSMARPEDKHIATTLALAAVTNVDIILRAYGVDIGDFKGANTAASRDIEDLLK